MFPTRGPDIKEGVRPRSVVVKVPDEELVGPQGENLARDVVVGLLEGPQVAGEPAQGRLGVVGD